MEGYQAKCRERGYGCNVDLGSLISFWSFSHPSSSATGRETPLQVEISLIKCECPSQKGNFCFRGFSFVCCFLESGQLGIILIAKEARVEVAYSAALYHINFLKFAENFTRNLKLDFSKPLGSQSSNLPPDFSYDTS